jgi:hypothetical protein
MDPHYFYEDLDPTFHFNEDPDRTYHFNADPDPADQNGANLRPLVYRPSRFHFKTLMILIFELVRICISTVRIQLFPAPKIMWIRTHNPVSNYSQTLTSRLKKKYTWYSHDAVF